MVPRPGSHAVLGRGQRPFPKNIWAKVGSQEGNSLIGRSPKATPSLACPCCRVRREAGLNSMGSTAGQRSPRGKKKHMAREDGPCPFLVLLVCVYVRTHVHARTPHRDSITLSQLHHEAHTKLFPLSHHGPKPCAQGKEHCQRGSPTRRNKAWTRTSRPAGASGQGQRGFPDRVPLLCPQPPLTKTRGRLRPPSRRPSSS